MTRGGRARLPVAALIAALLTFFPLMVAAQAPASAAPVSDPAPFADWTAVVIAGDWRAGPAQSTQAFDNGRRDIAKALAEIGFAEDNVLQFSLRPSWPDDAPGLVVGAPEAMQRFFDKTSSSKAGCLFYLTSHGGPDGAVFGPDLVLTPALLKQTLDLACPARPSVVVVSACYSGVFVPVLAQPDRLVITAARKDRASFGCGAADVHTYFDECVLLSLPTTVDFNALGPAVQACVAGMERATRARPASSPQVAAGAVFKAEVGGRRFLHLSD